MKRQERQLMPIQACLNGARTPGEHPALPCTPAELAAAARAAVAAGASSLHIHPRSADGAQSLAAAHIGDALAAVRAACPDVPVGVSTLFTILPDQERRMAAVRQWDERPDFVSVNMAEPGTTELCTVLRELGVGIEAGLASVADAERYLALDLGSSCVRVLLEPEEADPTSALATVLTIESVLDVAGDRTPRLLHGEGPTAWPLIDAALSRAYETRIGLEDVLTLPDGAFAADNAALVQAAFARIAVGPVVLRQVEPDDLPSLYGHQRDPEAARMAGFPPRAWDAFQAHWARIQADETVINRTVLVGEQVAGSLACYPEDGERLIGYWFGRAFWGRGVATAALAQFVAALPPGPLGAYVARHNAASRRVLEKCGFVLEREDEEELFLRYPSQTTELGGVTRRVVTQFWTAMQANDWAAAATLFAGDYELHWPQSGERIRGGANFVAVNANYPSAGRWQFSIERLVVEGETAVTETTVTDGVVQARALTFTTVRAGRIARQVEYWPEPFEAPSWRATWVQR